MRITALVIIFLSFSVIAQPTQPKPDDEVLKIDTRLINLNVKVLDTKGKAVSNLTQADFEVSEDGAVQEIAHFQPVTAPVSLVLLLDLSGSTEKKRKLMTKAAQRFLESLIPEDTVAIAAFTDQYYWLNDFTRDRKALKKSVEKIKDIKGGTAYYDAMWATLDRFAKVKNARKAIVVLTDGVDNTIVPRTPPRWMTNPPDPNSPLAQILSQIPPNKLRGPNLSQHKFDELLTRATVEEVTIYPLQLNTKNIVAPKHFPNGNDPGDQIRRNVFKEINSKVEREYALADQQLKAVAANTNGDVFPVEREEELEGVFQRVAAELHLMYTLAYYPRNGQTDGGYRKLAVKVKPTGAQAKTRPGYVAK